MKSLRIFVSAALMLLLSVFTLDAQRIDKAIDFYLDHSDGQYAAGETVRLTAKVNGEYDKPVVLSILSDGVVMETRNLGVLKGTKEIYTDVRDVPSNIILNFAPEGSEDETDFLRIGYVVDREGFRSGFTRPKDFRRYWNGQVKTMRKSPMEVSMKEVPVEPASLSDRFECFEIELSMPEGNPVRGYMARPKNAAAKSLPIVMFFRAAGVAGGWCRSSVWQACNLASRGNGAIAVDVNAHGMKNGQPEEYYKALEEGELAGYQQSSLATKEGYYFRLMFLRDERAIDFATKQKAWDGKRLLVTGESQGGAQSAAMCGIDRRVSDAVMIVPAMLGTGDFLVGRQAAWPRPAKDLADVSAINAPYFDGAVMLQGSKANLCVEVGLIDTTCPVGGIFGAVNGCKGNVTLMTFPYRPHHLAKVPAQYMDSWHKDVEAVRLKYFEDFFK